MLSQTLDQTMAKAMKYESMTSAIKFGNYFRPNTAEQTVFKNPTEQQIKKSVKTEEKVFDNEILDFIVEDPNCVAPVFDFSSYDRTGLPFFKSLGIKLNINSIDDFLETEEIEEEQNLQ